MLRKWTYFLWRKTVNEINKGRFENKRGYRRRVEIPFSGRNSIEIEADVQFPNKTSEGKVCRYSFYEAHPFT